MDPSAFLIPLSEILIFGAAGLHLLFNPEKIQRSDIARLARRRFLAQFHPFPGFLKSPWYAAALRFMGGICLAVALLLIFTLVRGLLK